MGSHSSSQIELFVKFRVCLCPILRQVLSFSEIFYPNTFLLNSKMILREYYIVSLGYC